MTNAQPFSTKYTYIKANEKHPMSKPADYIFLSLDRNLTGEECEQLAQEYFETHNNRKKKKGKKGSVLTIDTS